MFFGGIFDIRLYRKSDQERYYSKEEEKLFDNEDIRDCFYKDYCRVLHSPSFRRLQNKCQLFPIGESDYFRNRLTHSLEVAQIARGITINLNQELEFNNNPIEPKIVELAGLAHDLGHPPFGHQGEKALDDCMAEKYGGFEGNAQTLRILSKIEKKVKDYRSDDFGMSRKGKDLRYGLNLTYRTLASIIKYDHKITNRPKIKLTKKIFFEEYSIILRRKYKKNVVNNIDGKIKKHVGNVKKILNFNYFRELLINNGIINDEGFPSDNDTFYENIENLKFDQALIQYENEIKNLLKSWFEKVKIQKGYYKTENDVVEKIKKYVGKNAKYEKFKTIECQIMDIADDIAFSTYDLEDALKGKFISIFDCLKPNIETLDYITKKLNSCEKLNKDKNNKRYNRKKVLKIFIRIFDPALKLSKFEETYTMKKDEDIGQKVIYCIRHGDKYNFNGYIRTYLTSSLVGKFIRGVKITERNCRYPVFTKIELDHETREEVEVLRNFTFFCLISSSLLKIPAHRGYDIVKSIFNELQKPDGYKLLPKDYRHIFLRTDNEVKRKRILCDFISGMTDRYVLEFYGRLKSENPQTIFKPI